MGEISENDWELQKILGQGQQVLLPAGVRLDQALAQVLPFSRSEITRFLKAPCLAPLKQPSELRSWQAEIAALTGKLEEQQLPAASILQEQRQLALAYWSWCARKPSYKSDKDELYFFLPPLAALDNYFLQAEYLPLNIIYEDEYLLVLDKEKGIVVHPAAGNWHHTLLQGVLYYLQNKEGDNVKPYLVHRIDKDTSGLLILAKTKAAQSRLQADLQVHAVKRIYRALAEGVFSESKFKIQGALGRDSRNPLRKAIVPDGKQAVTHITLLKQYVNCAYVEASLETGRTHQIRAHLAALQHPLVGDVLYGAKKFPAAVKLPAGQCLHACKLEFTHPITLEKMAFLSPLPAYFNSALQLAENGII